MALSTQHCWLDYHSSAELAVAGAIEAPDRGRAHRDRRK
jgi:hypothetical protein